MTDHLQTSHISPTTDLDSISCFITEPMMIRQSLVQIITYLRVIVMRRSVMRRRIMRRRIMRRIMRRRIMRRRMMRDVSKSGQ